LPKPINAYGANENGSREQTVAIDWSDVGIGALGEEMGGFVVSPAFFYSLDVADLPHLDRIAFAGYLTGLREAGWVGPAQLVRLGYTTAAFLRYGLGIIPFLPAVLDDAQRGELERIFGHSVEDVATHGIPIHQFLRRLADEVRQLIEALR
jgi:hypothetical protein